MKSKEMTLFQVSLSAQFFILEKQYQLFRIVRLCCGLARAQAWASHSFSQPELYRWVGGLLNWKSTNFITKVRISQLRVQKCTLFNWFFVFLILFYFWGGGSKSWHFGFGFVKNMHFTIVFLIIWLHICETLTFYYRFLNNLASDLWKTYIFLSFSSYFGF